MNNRSRRGKGSNSDWSTAQDKTNFNSPFIKVPNEVIVTQKVSPFGELFENIFKGFTWPQIQNEACLSESRLYGSRKDLTLRQGLATKPYLDKFSIRYLGTLQVPIIFVCTMVSIVVFSDHELRSLFNLYAPKDTKILATSHLLYKNIRVYNSDLSRIVINSTLSTAAIAFGLQGTLVDPQFLLNDESARNAAFELILGNFHAESYELKVEPFVPLSFITNVLHVNSIHIDVTQFGAFLRIAPFSHISIINKFYDPTIIQAMIAVLIGSQLFDTAGNPLSFANLNMTSFSIKLNSSNYFNTMYDFLLSVPVGNINPGNENRPEPPAASESSGDQNAMMCFSGYKSSSRPIPVNENVFFSILSDFKRIYGSSCYYKFLRTNKLWKLRLSLTRPN